MTFLYSGTVEKEVGAGFQGGGEDTGSLSVGGRRQLSWNAYVPPAS